SENNERIVGPGEKSGLRHNAAPLWGYLSGWPGRVLVVTYLPNSLRLWCNHRPFLGQLHILQFSISAFRGSSLCQQNSTRSLNQSSRTYFTATPERMNFTRRCTRCWKLLGPFS